MADQASTDQAPAGALSVTRWGATAYLVAAGVILLDQISKYWVLNVLHLPDRPPIQVLPFFHLTMVWNPGVSFGLLRADTPMGKWLLVAFALAIVIALVIWARRLTRPLLAVSVGFMLGGALGNNLIDRIRFGAVVDFVDFHPIFPWVFNVADAGINVGVALLLIDSFLSSKKPSAT